VARVVVASGAGQIEKSTLCAQRTPNAWFSFSPIVGLDRMFDSPGTSTRPTLTSRSMSTGRLGGRVSVPVITAAAQPPSQERVHVSLH
jgi:hypothetical protein